MGSTSITAGKIGNAFNFSSTTSDYVQLPSMALKLTGDFSISCWIYRTSSEATIKPILRDYPFQAGSGQRGWEFFLNSAHQIAFRRQYDSSAAGAGDGTNATISVPLNTWTHIGMTWNATTRQVNFIQDGDVVRTITLAQYNIYYPNPDSLNVSRITNGNFNGKIDGLTVWTRLLTGSEITALRNGGNGTQYPFTGQTLTSKNDSVGTNHGTLVNGATFTTGKIGQAFLFDGVNDCVSYPNDYFEPASSFSSNFWIKTNNDTTTQTIYTSVASNGFLGWRAFITNGTINFRTFPSGTSQNQLVTTNSQYVSGSWYMLTFINDLTTGMSIYVNGQQVASNSIKQAISWGSTTINKLGQNWDNGSVFNGAIDMFTLWNKALTSDEISYLYNSGNGIQYPFT